MDISNITDQVMVIVNKRWAHSPNEGPRKEDAFIHLQEEIGEIARQLFNESIGSEKYSEQNLHEEIIDALFDILILARLSGVDVEAQITEKLQLLGERKQPR
ncbi:MAG: hypothetical protein HOE53_03740 [Candidatus Magasanikbacteria bacterium]|jgi:NTP pyrophosphatase (non-canonical NTP hydrolase)|nr:hypothetical protein [Candidatus Magasanikbacteria bacterium]